MGEQDLGQLRPRLAQVLAIQRWGHQLAAAVSPLGTVLATAGTDRVVRLWDPATGRCRHSLRGHSGRITGLAFSPDGRTLASCASDATVRLWDPSAGQPRAVLHNAMSRAPVTDPAALSQARRTLVDPDTGRHRHTLDVAVPDEDGSVWPLEKGFTHGFAGLAFSPDGQVLVSHGDKLLQVWDATTGEHRHTVGTPHRHSVRGLAFAPDGRLLATLPANHVGGRLDGSVHVYDPGNGRYRGAVECDDLTAFRVTFSPDSRTLAVGELNTTPLWDTATLTKTRTIAPPRSNRAGGPRAAEMATVAFSPDGGTVVTAGHNGVLLLCRATTGACLHVLADVEYGGFRDATFSPDGSLLATCGDDKHVRLWSVADGRLLHAVRPPGRWNYVNHVAFVPGGRLLAGYGLNRKMWLWELRPEHGR